MPAVAVDATVDLVARAVDVSVDMVVARAMAVISAVDMAKNRDFHGSLSWVGSLLTGQPLTWAST